MTNMRWTRNGRLVLSFVVACLFAMAAYLVGQAADATLPGCTAYLDDGTVIEVGDCDTQTDVGRP